LTKIFNRAEEKETRKQLRRIMPEAEVILWSKLKGKAAGYKFRRQYSIGRYVIDFYCPTLKLAIEVDGDSHFNQGAEDRDKDRQEFMESYGVVFYVLQIETSMKMWMGYCL